MVRVNYTWDRYSDNVLMESDENGDTTAVYTNEPDQYGELISQRRDNTTSYYQYDGQGSTRQLTDDTETVTDTATYSAFGEEVASSGATTNPFGYKGAVGYYANPETDDLYVRARTYQPAVGRWLSADPAGYVDGVNLYEYAASNPIRFADASGRDLFDLINPFRIVEVPNMPVSQIGIVIPLSDGTPERGFWTPYACHCFRGSYCSGGLYCVGPASCNPLCVLGILQWTCHRDCCLTFGAWVPFANIALCACLQLNVPSMAEFVCGCKWCF